MKGEQRCHTRFDLCGDAIEFIFIVGEFCRLGSAAWESDGMDASQLIAGACCWGCWTAMV